MFIPHFLDHHGGPLKRFIAAIGTTSIIAGSLFLGAGAASAANCAPGQHWNAMGAGSGFCSPNTSGGGTGADTSVDLGNLPNPPINMPVITPPKVGAGSMPTSDEMNARIKAIIAAAKKADDARKAVAIKTAAEQKAWADKVAAEKRAAAAAAAKKEAAAKVAAVKKASDLKKAAAAKKEAAAKVAAVKKASDLKKAAAAKKAAQAKVVAAKQAAAKKAAEVAKKAAAVKAAAAKKTEHTQPIAVTKK
jgi:hypothetical protein